jgi:hypothetical protein
LVEQQEIIPPKKQITVKAVERMRFVFYENEYLVGLSVMPTNFMKYII